MRSRDYGLIDLCLLWESVHTYLDRAQTRLDRSQFAFERSHSDRFWVRSISDRSNSLVWMLPYILLLSSFHEKFISWPYSVSSIIQNKFHLNLKKGYIYKRSVLRRQSGDTNRNIKRSVYCQIWIVWSNVSSIGPSSLAIGPSPLAVSSIGFSLTKGQCSKR